MKRSVCISLFSLLLLTGCIGYFVLKAVTSYVLMEDEPRQRKCSVMGVGDSITEGGDTFFTYLYPLWQKLKATGYDLEFIGPNKDKCTVDTILPNAGYGGRNVEYIEARFDSIYRKYPADIILLHAGHNHFSEEQPVSGMIDAYRSIIKKIRSVNPNALIFMAQVIPSGKLPKYAYIPELNEKIAEMVQDLHTSGIYLVNQADGFDWERHTVGDKVHPNKAGAEKMATVWFDAMKQVLNIFK